LVNFAAVNKPAMKKVLLVFVLTLGINRFASAQEIIPFPDLSEHHDYSKNGGKSDDERNYAIYTEDYQEALRVLDAESDRILALRKEETDPELIERHNKELESIHLKKMALLSEADLVEDLQKFY
jgi:hypothetical protein